jgi:hypothetical protein
MKHMFNIFGGWVSAKGDCNVMFSVVFGKVYEPNVIVPFQKIYLEYVASRVFPSS